MDGQIFCCLSKLYITKSPLSVIATYDNPSYVVTKHLLLLNQTNDPFIVVVNLGGVGWMENTYLGFNLKLFI